MDERRAWEMQEGEPARWYDRFDRYRLMPAHARSMLAVYADEARPGAKRPASVPGAWKEASDTWQWEERAAAWDRHEAARRQAEYDEERRRDKDQRITLLKATRNKLAQRLANLEAADIPAAALISGVRLVVEQLRAEYDDEPTQRQSGAVLNIDVASLTDEQLDRILAGDDPIKVVRG